MRFVVGCVLGHYRIIDQIGEGGMGVVYRAHDERLHRDVAIKVLPEEFISDSGRMERFEREARAAAALSHSNILAIHELGFHQGSPYIVTELLEGASLAEAMQGPDFSSRRALEFGIQVARGLAAAHEKGVIHRDLKPDNVFVTRDGTVKILDFGLAKLAPAAEPAYEAAEAKTETMQTAIGTVMGTAGYMSPEQVRGHPADARSDMFSFGVLLYEMLTGSSPFRRSTAADSVSAVLSYDPPAVSRAGGGIPTPVDAVVGRCLEKRPEDRYQSSRDLAHALDTAVNAPSRISMVHAVARFRVPRKAAAVAVVTVILAVAAAFLVSRFWVDPGSPQIVDPEPPRIVVLSFENLGAEDDSFFAAGISDEIMSRLGAVSQLGVVSGGGVAGDVGNILEFGREFDVQYALTGAVRWSRNIDGLHDVRITPKLIRLSDGFLMWSQSYDRRLDDIFEIQSDIAGRVLTELDVALLSGEREAVDSRPTSNMEAYQAYLRGLYYAVTSIEEDLFLAVSMFEAAVELDPGFAIAYAELSMAHTRLFETRVDPTQSRAASAAAAFERALDLEQELARGHLARAMFLGGVMGDPTAALAELQLARRGLPNDSRLLQSLGRLLLSVSRPLEAVDAFERAVEIDPTRYGTRIDLASLLLNLRRNAEADEVYRRAIDLHPDRLQAYMGRFWNALAWEGGTDLGHEILNSVPAPRHRDVFELQLFAAFADRDGARVLELLDTTPNRWVEYQVWRRPVELIECHALNWMGRAEEGRAACEIALAESRNALELNPRDPRVWAAVANSQVLLDNREDAIRAVERAYAMARSSMWDQAQFTGEVALIHAMLGNAGPAVDWLRTALDQPGWLTRAWIAFDWKCDPIRDDPRFQELTEPDD